MQLNWVPLMTDRLVIRGLDARDLETVFGILSCKQTCGGRIFEKKTRAEAEKWLKNRIVEQAKFGCSMWAVEKKDGAFIGLCGFVTQPPNLEICYIIRAIHQGDGFGSEAATALIESARSRHYRVIATIRNTNLKSLRVAEKIGMRRSDKPFSRNPALISFVSN